MNILFFLTLTLAQMHCPDSSFDLSSNSKDAVLDLFTSLKGNSVHCLIETLGKPQEIRYDIKWPNKHGYMSPPFYMPEVAAEEGGVESGVRYYIYNSESNGLNDDEFFWVKVKNEGHSKVVKSFGVASDK